MDAHSAIRGHIVDILLHALVGRRAEMDVAEMCRHTRPQMPAAPLHGALARTSQLVTSPDHY